MNDESFGAGIGLGFFIGMILCVFLCMEACETGGESVQKEAIRVGVGRYVPDPKFTNPVFEFIPGTAKKKLCGCE